MWTTKIFITIYSANTKEVPRLWWRYLPSAQCLSCCGPLGEVRDLPRMKQSCEKSNECSHSTLINIRRETESLMREGTFGDDVVQNLCSSQG